MPSISQLTLDRTPLGPAIAAAKLNPTYGNCWDNAPSETLFASLKVERLHGQRFETIHQAKDGTLAWLLWYNRTRLHSALSYVSPIKFEQDWNDAMEIAA